MASCRRGSSAIEWLGTCGALFLGAAAVTAAVAHDVEPAVDVLFCRLQHLGDVDETCVGRSRAENQRQDSARSNSWLLDRDALGTPPPGQPETGHSERALLSGPSTTPVSAESTLHGAAAAAYARTPHGEPNPKPSEPETGNRQPRGLSPQPPKPGWFGFRRLSPLALALTALNLYVLTGDLHPLHPVETEHGPVTLVHNTPAIGGECLAFQGLKSCRYPPLFGEETPEHSEIRAEDGTVLATRRGGELLLYPEAIQARAEQLQRWSFSALAASALNFLRGPNDTASPTPLQRPNRIVFWSLTEDGTETRITQREDGSLHQEVWYHGETAPQFIRRVVWIPQSTCGDACKHARVDENGNAELVCNKDGVCTVTVCFAAGTPVRTPSGPQPIETLQPGDLVLAKDPVSGETQWKPVVRTFETPNRPTRRITLRRRDGSTVLFDSLEATPEHPFFVDRVGWRGVQDLRTGDHVITHHGVATVLENVPLREKTTVFNLEVQDFHTYFVGRLDSWVHNTCEAYVDTEGVEWRTDEELQVVQQLLSHVPRESRRRVSEAVRSWLDELGGDVASRPEIARFLRVHGEYVVTPDGDVLGLEPGTRQTTKHKRVVAGLSNAGEEGLSRVIIQLSPDATEELAAELPGLMRKRDAHSDLWWVLVEPEGGWDEPEPPATFDDVPTDKRLVSGYYGVHRNGHYYDVDGHLAEDVSRWQRWMTTRAAAMAPSRLSASGTGVSHGFVERSIAAIPVIERLPGKGIRLTDAAPGVPSDDRVDAPYATLDEAPMADRGYHGAYALVRGWVYDVATDDPVTEVSGNDALSQAVRGVNRMLSHEHGRRTARSEIQVTSHTIDAFRRLAPSLLIGDEQRGYELADTPLTPTQLKANPPPDWRTARETYPDDSFLEVDDFYVIEEGDLKGIVYRRHVDVEREAGVRQQLYPVPPATRVLIARLLDLPADEDLPVSESGVPLRYETVDVDPPGLFRASRGSGIRLARPTRERLHSP